MDTGHFLCERLASTADVCLNSWMEPRHPNAQLTPLEFGLARLWPFRLVIIVAWIVALGLPAIAATRAIIVVGLATDEKQADRFRGQAEAAQRGFLARGLPAAGIKLLVPARDTLVRRDAVLAALHLTGAEVSDETWILLLGHSALGRAGQPAFQVSGPRLTADDLATALGQLPGKKFVVIATANSGGFLAPLLVVPQVEAVAATADTGEINEPRFAEAWTDALIAQPRAEFTTLAAEAVRTVGRRYAQKSLALAEHAQLIDRAAGKIVDVPVSRAESPAATPP